MISIEEHHVDSLASNAGAIRNGRDLVAKGRYAELCVSSDGSIVFGKCGGSGASVYDCSVDFADAARPRARCSCPSRQSPCKHCLGLLYAWVGDSGRFARAELPPALAAKRETARTRATTRKTRSSPSGKAGKSNRKALLKKLQAQADALELLDGILAELLARGLGAYGHKEAAALEANAARLRAAYLPGAELALLRLSAIVRRASRARQGGGGDGDNAVAYHRAMDELARLEALIRRGRTYLQNRIDDAELKPETDSGIAAWLGHAWQYEELQAAGCSEPGAELMQLAFFVGDDPIKREYADTGIWVHLDDGRLFHTETLRPYRAAGHVRGDDSFFGVARVPDFVRYPGEAPPRVRWREHEHRDARRADHERVHESAQADFATLLKWLRNAFKSPLGPRHPIALVRPVRVGAVHAAGTTRHVMEDGDGVRIELCDPQGPSHDVPPSARLLPLLGERATGSVVLCRFHVDPATRRLGAQPLTFVHAGSMTRLVC